MKTPIKSDYVYHAWFSQQQKDRQAKWEFHSGNRPPVLSNMWKTEYGRIVEATTVCKTYVPPRWPDAIYLGKVVEWVNSNYY